MFERNPAFRSASRQIQEMARRAFASTQTGRLVQQAQRALNQKPRGRTPDINAAMALYQRQGASAVLKNLRGTQLGEFARAVEVFSRGPSRRLVDQFLDEMGTAGKLIKALIGPGARLRDELESMADVLRQFGYQVEKPRKGGRNDKWLKDAREELKRQGWTLVPPGEQPPAAGGAGGGSGGPRLPGPWGEGEPPGEYGQTPVSRSRVFDLSDEWRSRVPPNHPIVTGAMVKTPGSTNIESVGYDLESRFLYVRYLGYVRGDRGTDGRAKRGGPGSLYRYWPVLPETFMDLLTNVSHPGHWMWDHIRVRGTWGQHYTNYELVGIQGDYVPRQAMRRWNPATREHEEWFVRRQVLTPSGQTLVSPLKTERAPEMEWGQPDRGEPDRGTPDRGR